MLLPQRHKKRRKVCLKGKPAPGSIPLRERHGYLLQEAPAKITAGTSPAGLEGTPLTVLRQQIVNHSLRVSSNFALHVLLQETSCSFMPFLGLPPFSG